MTQNADKFIDRVKEKEEKIARFSDLLDSLESTEDKKKLLWKLRVLMNRLKN